MWIAISLRLALMCYTVQGVWVSVGVALIVMYYGYSNYKIIKYYKVLLIDISVCISVCDNYV